MHVSARRMQNASSLAPNDQYNDDDILLILSVDIELMPTDELQESTLIRRSTVLGYVYNAFCYGKLHVQT